jgi:hypothetical protein
MNKGYINPTLNSSNVIGNLKFSGFPTIENHNVVKIGYAPRPNQQRIEREARSINTSRHHQKSQTQRTPRENMSQVSKSQRSEIQPRSRVGKSEVSQKSSQRTEPQEIKQTSQHQQSQTTDYKKISDTYFSDVNNLVCDICVNKNSYENKMKSLEQQREEDRQFAQAINQDLKEQLEREKQMNTEKKKIYQEALINQRHDMEERKEQLKNDQKEQDEKIRLLLANNDDLIDRMALEEAKREKFINDLMKQMGDNERKRAQEQIKQLEIDKRNPNLLIDDAWRGPKREAIKEYYKNNLINQIKEKDEKLRAEMSQQGREDEYYKNTLNELIKNEEDKKKKLNEQKKAILMNELENQLDEKQRMQQHKQNLADEEDNHVRLKHQNDNRVYMINMEKKKNAMKDYINDLGDQIDNDKVKKECEIIDLKKKTNTGLDMGKKPERCYNCALCRLNYPMKQLNKRKRK